MIIKAKKTSYLKKTWGIILIQSIVIITILLLIIYDSGIKNSTIWIISVISSLFFIKSMYEATKHLSKVSINDRELVLYIEELY